jgi:hypothetical protein
MIRLSPYFLNLLLCEFFVHGFVHGKFLDSGEFGWISLDSQKAVKVVGCRLNGLYWISLKLCMVAGAGFEPTTFRL